jgi:uncharacterized Zn finger protein
MKTDEELLAEAEEIALNSGVTCPDCGAIDWLPEFLNEARTHAHLRCDDCMRVSSWIKVTA